MTRRLVVAVVVAALVAPLPALAAGKKTAGALLTLTGSALMLSAFNYKTSCPAGYSTHTFENLPTQCVLITSTGSDVRQAPTKMSYRRPKLMWSGVGAATTGIVLLLLPTRAANVVDVSVTPTGWVASTTFGF